MDYLLNTSTHTSSSGAFSPPSSPLSSPHRRPSASTHYPQPLSKDSRLCAPTVATVMRSLDTAQHSPVIKRLHRELQEQTSRAYLFRGSKLVHNLNHLKEQKAARRKKKVKRKKSKPMKARSDSAEYQ